MMMLMTTRKKKNEEGETREVTIQIEDEPIQEDKSLSYREDK